MDKNANLVFSGKNNDEKAVLETIDMEDIRSVATIRVINCIFLVFGHIRCKPCKDCRKILSAMASKLKENDVSFKNFPPNVKLTKEQLNLKTKHYAHEGRQLRASQKMRLERIKSIIDEEGILLESDINDMCCKANAQDKYFDSLDPDSPPISFMRGTKEEPLDQEEKFNEVAPCNDNMVHKYMLKVSR